MERMLVVVFDDEAKAYEGSRALQGLREDSIIAMHASRAVTKNPDGTTTVIKTHDALPEGTMGATAVGSLIGMFGGPLGLAVGAASGFVIGATTDLARGRVADDFVRDVEQMLRPGTSAVAAAIDEESTDPVNARVTAFGASVLRRDLSDVWDSEYEQNVAAIETDIARTKAEYAVSRAARRAKLQARIDALNEKPHQALDRAKAKREDIGRQAAARVEHLKAERQAR